VPQWQEILAPDVTIDLSNGARHTRYSEKFCLYRVLSVDDNWAEAKADILPEAVAVCNIHPNVHWCSVPVCDANSTGNLLINRVGRGGGRRGTLCGEGSGGGGTSSHTNHPSVQIKWNSSSRSMFSDSVGSFNHIQELLCFRITGVRALSANLWVKLLLQRAPLP